MPKIINKKDCKYVNRYIVKDDEVVAVPGIVYDLLNRLELMLQQKEYLDAQPKFHPFATLEGFKFESENFKTKLTIEFDAPVHEEMEAKAEAFARECDLMKKQEDLDKMGELFSPLFDWVENDSFVEGTCDLQFDLSTIGNPLELKGEDLAAWIMEVVMDEPCIPRDSIIRGDTDGDRR